MLVVHDFLYKTHNKYGYDNKYEYDNKYKYDNKYVFFSMFCDRNQSLLDRTIKSACRPYNCRIGRRLLDLSFDF